MPNKCSTITSILVLTVSMLATAAPATIRQLMSMSFIIPSAPASSNSIGVAPSAKVGLFSPPIYAEIGW